METLSSDGYLPEEAYPTKVTKTAPEHIKIGFEAGEPVSLNGEKMSPVDVIRKIRDIAGPFGIGRDIHVGDTIIGIKGRVAFEAAAPLIIIKAHHLLEKHVLTKGQLYWKDQIAGWYGQQMHEAMYKFGSYGEINKSYTGADVVGFTKVLANPLKIYYSVNSEHAEDVVKD